jgi:hypothetical protein
MHARTGGASSIGSGAAVMYMVKVTVAIAVSWLDTLRGRVHGPEPAGAVPVAPPARRPGGGAAS